MPANCKLTVKFWARTTTTETSRGDYLNVSFAVTGVPPTTYFSLSSEGSPDWYQYSGSTGTATTDRSATVSFYASETAGNGVTAFDVDDVRFTLGRAGPRPGTGSAAAASKDGRLEGEMWDDDCGGSLR